MLTKSKHNKSKNAKIQAHKGFTLSEVLITLGILGLVAAFGIPSLMRKTQDMEYKAAAKKAYSVSAQVVMQMKAENGGSLVSYIGVWHSFKPVFMTYFKTLQDCGWCDCVLYEDGTSSVYTSLSGDKANMGILNEGQFVTADGMFFAIENNTGNIYITVDVNGYQKKPNIWGKDIFTFQLINDTLLPMGANGTSLRGYCDKTVHSNSQGSSCMYNVMNGIDY